MGELIGGSIKKRAEASASARFLGIHEPGIAPFMT